MSPMMTPGMGMGGPPGMTPPGMPMPPGMGTPPSAGAFGPVAGPVDPSALLQLLLPMLMGMGGGMPGMPPMGGGMPTVLPQAPIPGLPAGGMMPPAGGPPLY